MKKRIVLCADDYGQAPAISRGILGLIEKGRLSAVSCLVNTPCWPEHAAWLFPYKKHIDMGLHVNLTEGIPLSDAYRRLYGETFFPLHALLRKAFLRRLDQAVIEAECHAQLDHFQAAAGFLPDHIDGHQHVHQFPLIRDALVQVYLARFHARRGYVRLINETMTVKDWFGKKAIIYLSGTRQLSRLLTRYHIPCNQSFAGIYGFNQADRYSQLFPQFLAKIGDKGMIVCHPSLEAAIASDGITRARFLEYQYLAGPCFSMDCDAQGVVIGRFELS